MRGWGRKGGLMQKVLGWRVRSHPVPSFFTPKARNRGPQARRASAGPARWAGALSIEGTPNIRCDDLASIKRAGHTKDAPSPGPPLARLNARSAKSHISNNRTPALQFTKFGGVSPFSAARKFSTAMRPIFSRTSSVDVPICGRRTAFSIFFKASGTLGSCS